MKAKALNMAYISGILGDFRGWEVITYCCRAWRVLKTLVFVCLYNDDVAISSFINENSQIEIDAALKVFVAGFMEAKRDLSDTIHNFCCQSIPHLVT